MRPALSSLRPYEPGRPIEEVQRALGLERVVKLASNEGPFGPFPAALAAIERSLPDLNRYPDGGATRLREALAEIHAVTPSQVIVCAGADAVIGCAAQALLDPGDEVVTGWPSFPSYVIDTVKMGATPVTVPLAGHVLDLGAVLAAIGDRTKIVYIATPNNPTGTVTLRAELDRFLDMVPAHVLTVVDQAYFEYVDDAAYPDAIAEHVRQGRNVLVLRTFSKIYGLAGLRVGYGVGPQRVIDELGKVRRPFDVTTAGLEAALASLDDQDEIARRRAVNRRSMDALHAALVEHGFEPAGPAAGNFLFVEVHEATLGMDAGGLADALLHEGVIVRPTGGFGAEDGLRVTAGTPEEIAFLANALTACRSSAGTRR